MTKIVILDYLNIRLKNILTLYWNLNSTIMDYKTNKSHLKLNEYLTLDNLANGWRKEVERDFNIISDKIIKETLKCIK